MEEFFFVCLEKVVLHNWKFIEGIMKRKSGMEGEKILDVKIYVAKISFPRNTEK